jgi:hypothetical protein
VRGRWSTGRFAHEHHRRDRDGDPAVPRRVPEEQIDDLRRRIAATRWPTKELVDDRSQGVQLAAMQALTRYWLDEYDFGRIEARLNALPQFVTAIDGVDIHFIHVRSSHENALPLIITHGWPGSVIEMLDVIEPLTDPNAHGGKPRTRSTSYAVAARLRLSASQPRSAGSLQSASRRRGQS